jgi:hypothetical protein
MTMLLRELSIACVVYGTRSSRIDCRKLRWVPQGTRIQTGDSRVTQSICAKLIVTVKQVLIADDFVVSIVHLVLSTESTWVSLRSSENFRDSRTPVHLKIHAAASVRAVAPMLRKIRGYLWAKPAIKGKKVQPKRHR